MKNNKQIIKCDVVNCKYNDDIEYLCTLDSIDVSCTCDNNSCNNKDKTICNSFDKKKE